MSRLSLWVAATLASAAIGAYVGRDNLWAVLAAAVAVAIIGWAIGTPQAQERIPFLRSDANRLLMTYLDGRELYTAFKAEQQSGDPQWSEWQPMLYAYEDEVYDTLHRSARPQASAIFRRMQMLQTDDGHNWQSSLRQHLNERLTELERLLTELPHGA
jgi:hypothetical protein